MSGSLPPCTLRTLAEPKFRSGADSSAWTSIRAGKAVSVVPSGLALSITSSGRLDPLWPEANSTPSVESAPRWNETAPGPVIPAVTSYWAQDLFESFPASARTASAAGRVFQVTVASCHELVVADTLGPSEVEFFTRRRSVALVIGPVPAGTVKRR